MCGLVGYAGFAGHVPQDTENTSLKEMTETLACRGPDASAVWAEGAAGLGHTRLAIVDLVGGRQPMVLARDGRTVLAVAFTGEIYNHARLRSELTALGHRFTTRRDSEVVLHAIDAWGEAASARLEGRFAYAAWEPGPRRLTLVRDRFGIKPLYYARIGDAVVFGSEPKAVLTHPAVPARLDVEGLRELLRRFCGIRPALLRRPYPARPSVAKQPATDARGRRETAQPVTVKRAVAGPCALGSHPTVLLARGRASTRSRAARTVIF
ncbi:hypothetical protein ABZ835_45485 [Streptomyces sp. NPDC047461]|uniref:hypothetical protein n=1 Tax=Streptomyces sp. NPDC047461 TaxID=3155619 RepID=UPI0034080072